MKREKYFLIVVLVVITQHLLLSCENRKNSNSIEIGQYEQLNKNEKESSRLFAKAINEGDFKSYNEISNAYLLSQRNDELYYYSLLMANKHKCPEAFYHLFVILNERITVNGVELYSTDEATRNMSLYYLLKSRELGYEKAQYDINDIFGSNTTNPSSSVYLNKIE